MTTVTRNTTFLWHVHNFWSQVLHLWIIIWARIWPTFDWFWPNLADFGQTWLIFGQTWLILATLVRPNGWKFGQLPSHVIWWLLNFKLGHCSRSIHIGARGPPLPQQAPPPVDSGLYIMLTSVICSSCPFSPILLLMPSLHSVYVKNGTLISRILLYSLKRYNKLLLLVAKTYSMWIKRISQTCWTQFN